MINIKVVEEKIKIDDKEYTFRLDFKALIKFEERYENAIELFNSFLQGKKIYNCIVKILSCSCVEKDFTEEELTKKLGFSLPVMKIVDEMTIHLINGVIQEKKEDIKNKTEKN